MRLSDKVNNFEKELLAQEPLEAQEIAPACAYSKTWLEHKLSVAELINGMKDGDEKNLCEDVFRRIMNGREFVRVNPEKASKEIDAGTIYAKSWEDLIFSTISVAELKQQLLFSAGKLLYNRKQNDLVDTFLSTIPIIRKKERRFIGVSEDLYWDSKSRTLLHRERLGEHRCFIRLFDSSDEAATGGKIHFPVSTFNQDFAERVEVSYETALKKLRALPDDCTFKDITAIPHNPNLSFILEWADDRLGVYWDILTMFATGFMDKKPLGAYFLIGLSRNGKSTCANLLCTLFGTNNAPGVCLSELGDYHKTAILRYALFNVPDDEDDDINQYQKEFKQLAAHQTVKVSRMRSQEPFSVPGSQFTMVFPMNAIPVWRRSSAVACAKRTIIIPFTRDFSKIASENSIGSFEERTFTPSVLATLSAEAMALATFFKERPDSFGYSDTVMEQRATLQNESGSVDAYEKVFHKYFYGFGDWKVLYMDYKLWCVENDYNIKALGDLKLAFQNYRGEKCRTNQVYETKNGKESKKARHAAFPQNRWLMMSDAWFPEIKRTVSELHESGRSTISVFDQALEARLSWVQQLTVAQKYNEEADNV